MKSKPALALAAAIVGALVSTLAFALLVPQLFPAADWTVSDWLALLAPAAATGAIVGACVWLMAPRRTEDDTTRPQAAPSSPRRHARQQKPVAKPARRKHNPFPLAGRIAADLKWLRATKKLRRFLHAELSDLRAASFLERVHPEDISLIDQALEDAKARRKTPPVTLRLFSSLSPQRSTRANETAELPLPRVRSHHVRLKIRGRFDKTGTFRCYDFGLVDVSELTRAQQAARRHVLELSLVLDELQKSNQDLERLKESYRDLYQNAPIMFFSLDPEGRLVAINDTLLRRLGYEREELLGATYPVLLAPSAAASWRRANGRSPAQALAERPVETTWRMKTGGTLDVWVRSVPVLDEAGRFVRSRSAAMDLSERNRLAQELRARGDELEQANARLRQINAELEDFTHVVSHDLKEPLRTLQAFSNILAQDYSAQLGPDGFECINHLNQASRRLGSLIDDLLRLSQAGRGAGKPEPFDLIEAVAVARRDLADLLQRREATVLTEGSLPTVVGDPKRITQLLANLVANGLKYNKSPAPKVVIGVAHDPPMPAGLERLDARHVAVFVRDNGIGIDPRFHQQIFGIFRRLQPHEFEGTGAGLAICKKIVEAHGGHIWVDSHVGAGATFYFTLPLATVAKANGTALAAASRRAERRPTPLPPTRSLPRLPKKRVEPAAPRLLLVEDMEDVALIVRRLAARTGLKVTWFPTAEEAWEHLQGDEPDLLLLDVNLPGMTGIDLCRKVRRELGRGEVPIVIFTQDQGAPNRELLREAGATHLLSKDLLCEPQEWDRRIREVLGAAGGVAK